MHKRLMADLRVLSISSFLSCWVHRVFVAEAAEISIYSRVSQVSFEGNGGHVAPKLAYTPTSFRPSRICWARLGKSFSISSAEGSAVTKVTFDRATAASFCRRLARSA